jgi:multiple sugar transport system substrate-binding protein
VATAAPILGFNGAIYAVPFQSGGPALFYNEDYLKEAGLNGPPRTVVELYDYAKKLRKTNAAGELIRAGLSIRLTGPGGGTQKFSFIAYQFSGKQVLTPGKKPGTFYATADAPGQAEALMWFVGLLNGNDKADDWGLKHDSEGFAAGDAAMLMRESWVVPYLKENAPDLHYGVSLQPKGKYWGVYDYFAGFTVPEAGKNKAAAWDFARSTQEKVVMEMLLKESGWIPPRRDLDYGTVFAAEPHYKAFIQQPKDLPTYFEASCAASHEIWVSVGEIIQAAYRDASLVNNLAGCQAVMKKANDKANEILKRMNEYGE